MLTTLLSIGSVVRNQPGAAGIKHHRYVRQIPSPQKDQSLRRYVVQVEEDMSFDLAKRVTHDNEVERSYLFYLNYKSSDADSMKKYLFGDICRYRIRKPKENAYSDAEVNFVLGDPSSGASMFQVNSFERGKQDAAGLQHPGIGAFRSCLDEQMDDLLDIFEQEKSVYINFRFGNNHKHWYEMASEFDVLNTKLLNQFVEKVPEHGFVLTKSLYKTLAAGKMCAPQFTNESAYKSWFFPNLEEVSDLLYAVDFSQKALIRKGDIKIVVLPRSEMNGATRLSAQDIEQFFSGLRSLRRIAGKEQTLSEDRQPDSDANEDDEPELTEAYERAQEIETISQFDFIFSKASASASSPDIDMIELCGVAKSRLGEMHQQLEGIRRNLNTERTQRFIDKNFVLKKPPSPLRILNSFNNVLGEVGREKKKFSSHLLKVLPQIYCGTYVQDDLLLPAFIETTERKIREGSPNYDFLRFDYLFLRDLQDVNAGRRLRAWKDKEMLTQVDQASYNIGQLLGKMARPLRAKINSFEKEYIGHLSRRVGQQQDIIAFHNFMAEKLILHDCDYPNLKAASRNLATLLLDFPTSYNREFCVIGFFESYFEPVPKKTGDGNKDESGTTNTEDDPTTPEE